MSAYSDAILADNPQWFLELNESSGTVANDSSPNGLDGTIEGSPTFSVAGLVDDDGTCFDFDGGTDGVRVDDTFAGTEMSIEAWISIDNNIGQHNIITGETVGNSGRCYLRLEPGTGKIQVVFFTSTGLQGALGTAAIPTNGRTYHIVGRCKSEDFIDIYVDGCFVSEHTSSAIGTVDTMHDLGVWQIAKPGVGATFRPFEGRLDNLAIYHYALSATQIRNHFSIGTSYLGIDGEGCFDSPPVVETCSLLETDDVLLVDATYQDVTVTLMDPAPLVGHVYRIRRIDNTSNTVTLDPGTLLIDGLPSVTMLPDDALALVTTGMEWYLI